MLEVNSLKEEEFGRQFRVGQLVVASWSHVVEQNFVVVGTQDRELLLHSLHDKKREGKEKDRG